MGDAQGQQQFAQRLRIRLAAEGMAVDIGARAHLAEDEAQAALHGGAAGAIGVQQGAVDIEENQSRCHQREPGRVTGAIGAAVGFAFVRPARASLMTT